MPKKVFCMLLGGWVFLGQLHAQQVIVAGGESGPATAKKPAVTKPTAAQTVAKEFPKATPVKEAAMDAVAKAQAPTNSLVKTRPPIPKPAAPEELKPQSSPPLVMIAHSASAGSSSKSKAPTTKPSPAKIAAQATAPSVANIYTQPVRPTGSMPDARTMRLTRVEGPAPEPQHQLPLSAQDSSSPTLKMPLETAFVKLADGFDFPVGKPEAQGYYKARGFRSHGHMGEDWDGIRGGDTDLGDPIYCIGEGIVVFARDCHMGWGNVIIVRHSYREGGMVKNVDSLYGHCDRILVHRGQIISRGQQIATIGTAHGLYDAHLHLEIRKNIEIGMSRAKFAQDSSNYYDPTQFINLHRHLQGGGASYKVAMNTFIQDSKINWAATRNYKHARTGGGSRESAAALKKAVAKKN